MMSPLGLLVLILTCSASRDRPRTRARTCQRSRRQFDGAFAAGEQQRHPTHPRLSNPRAAGTAATFRILGSAGGLRAANLSGDSDMTLLARPVSWFALGDTGSPVAASMRHRLIAGHGVEVLNPALRNTAYPTRTTNQPAARLTAADGSAGADVAAALRTSAAFLPVVDGVATAATSCRDHPVLAHRHIGACREWSSRSRRGAGNGAPRRQATAVKVSLQARQQTSIFWRTEKMGCSRLTRI